MMDSGLCRPAMNTLLEGKSSSVPGGPANTDSEAMIAPAHPSGTRFPRSVGDPARVARIRVLLLGFLALWSGPMLRAQWLTQSFDLVAGWNAVYLHVDASYAPLDDLLANAADQPIEEIWQWNAALPNAQFTQNPAIPSDTGTPWSSWKRGQGPAAVLKRLPGNTAYLVRVAATTPTHRWNLRGKPVGPRSDWTTTGLNFVGFPTPPNAPPSFDAFLRPAPALMNGVEIFRYTGGVLGSRNPAQVFALKSAPVRRGEAFWMRTGDLYNRYFGPFSLNLPGGTELNFSDASGPQSVRLRNLNPGELTVTLTLVASETPPTGQPAISGAPPILLRGTLNSTNLTFGSSDLATARTWTLKPAGQPGSEVEIVLGINRSLMSDPPGALYAAVLRFSDSLSLTAVEVPVSATVASKAGLWVGAAAVTQVRHYLKTYKKDGDGKPILSPSGKYEVASVKDNLGSVADAYPMRLIVHTDATGANARLLQRAYLGIKRDATPGITTTEALLDPAQLAHARRISSAHFPYSAGNLPWPCTGQLSGGSTLTTTVTLDYADSTSNPFLHEFHPDHDNRNATFDRTLSRGEESYEVSRKISLKVTPPAGDFTSLTRSYTTLSGDYEELITLTGITKPGRPSPEKRTFEVRGAFELNRVTDPLPLTTQ